MASVLQFPGEIYTNSVLQVVFIYASQKPQETIRDWVARGFFLDSDDHFKSWKLTLPCSNFK